MIANNVYEAPASLISGVTVDCENAVDSVYEAPARSRSLSRIFAGLSAPPDLRILACSDD